MIRNCRGSMNFLFAGQKLDISEGQVKDLGGGG